MSISRTSKGNENWLEKSGVGYIYIYIGGKITVKQIQEKRLLIWFELSGFLRNRGFEKSVFHCMFKKATYQVACVADGLDLR